MAISTFEIKICSQKLCTQKDGFRKFSHNYCHWIFTCMAVFSMMLLKFIAIAGWALNDAAYKLLSWVIL